MAKLLQGQEVNASLNQKTRDICAQLGERCTPALAIVRCGDNPSDLAYERGAMRRAEALGVACQSCVLPADVSAEALLAQIRQLNADPTIHGVLLLRPLPRHLAARQHEICNALTPEKDVDGMTDASIAAVFEGREDIGFPPCTPRAVIEILDHYGIDCTGKRAVVIGRSLVVGRPVLMLLLARHATVTICHTRTQDLPAITRGAEIIVSAAGALGSLTRAHVREGQIVIDVSMNWDPDKPNPKGGYGAMAGDARFDEIESIVGAITPVPGGVGAVTTAVLMNHVARAALRQCGSSH